MLAAAGLGRYAAAYRTAYPLEPPDEPADAATARFFAVVAGRVSTARSSTAPSPPRAPALPPDPAVDDADVVRMVAAAQAWLAWADSLWRTPPGRRHGCPTAWSTRSAWRSPASRSRPRSTPTAASTGTRSPPPATAPPGHGGPPVTVIPAPVTYPGMPAPRLWEFEDANVSFGDVQAHPEDLGRLLLTEFALVYGGDWLLVPVEVPVGSLVRVRSLLVHDTFGQRVRIAPAPGDDGWRMFRLSPDGDPGLLVPPALVVGLHGRDLEEVLLLRDEAANLAWAVERTVEGEHGLPVDRAQAAYASTPEPEAPHAEGEAFTYRLIERGARALAPAAAAARAARRAGGRARGRRRRRRRPHGRVLSPGAVLREEEVPREGRPRHPRLPARPLDRRLDAPLAGAAQAGRARRGLERPALRRDGLAQGLERPVDLRLGVVQVEREADEPFAVGDHRRRNQQDDGGEDGSGGVLGPGHRDTSR